jgi:CheY-like chemotaxis protein
VRDGSSVEISVADTGIGLAPETLQHVFQMYVQVGSPLERTEAGLGIGLALAKALIDLHGGQISAESAGLGHGTTIRVRLAAAAGPPPEIAPATPAVVDTQTGGAVLIADDNRDAAESLAALLRLAGHRAVTVSDGVAAIAEIERLRPRVALLDIGMPGKTGYEVAAHVRGQPWGGAVSLVALTGWGQSTDRARALAAGFDEHWVKPVDAGRAVEFCNENLGAPQPQ